MSAPIEVRKGTRSREEAAIPLAVLVGVEPADVQAYLVFVDNGTREALIATDMNRDTLTATLHGLLELVTGQEWHS